MKYKKSRARIYEYGMCANAQFLFKFKSRTNMLAPRWTKTDIDKFEGNWRMIIRLIHKQSAANKWAIMNWVNLRVDVTWPHILMIRMSRDVTFLYYGPLVYCFPGPCWLCWHKLQFIDQILVSASADFSGAVGLSVIIWAMFLCHLIDSEISICIPRRCILFSICMAPSSIIKKQLSAVFCLLLFA
jgi:hypothetical protein